MLTFALNCMYIYVAITVTEKPLQGSFNKVKSNQITSLRMGSGNLGDNFRRVTQQMESITSNIIVILTPRGE